MFAYAIDALSSYEIAVADTASTTMTADAGDTRLMPAVGSSVPTGSGWQVADIAGTNGLCFVRRGTGGWNGVIAVYDGHASPLSRVQRPVLQPAVFHKASAAAVAPASWINSARNAPATGTSLAWQRSVSYVLLAIGLGLAMKSGSMLLQGSRKYG